ncbi:MAG: DUF5071 domain-containing protein [Marinobacter sp.]|nr:DUF5071 domain-containing protein [Marinobacter sp.]
MTNLIPTHKCDDAACAALAAASNQEVIPYIGALLQCLQDLNWPIAGPVAERLAVMGIELAEPIKEVLSGNDEIWKYWLVSHLLHMVRPEVYQALLFKLNHMRRNPTAAERTEEVHDAVCCLLAARGMG